MKKLLKKFVKFSSNIRKSPAPLVNITISKKNLHHNLNQFRKISQNVENGRNFLNKKEIAPVLKSNAYGHGLHLVAEELQKENLPFFVIDSYFEAMALRNEGIKTPLLIIGYSRTESIAKNSFKDISFTITSIESLIDIAKNIKKPTHIYLKIDTGMHRQGILPEERDEAEKIIRGTKNLVLDGICSHFSDADGASDDFTKKQIAVWNDQVKFFREKFPTLKYWHISATAGSVKNGADANVIRLGIGLYGLIEVAGLDLRPAMEMRTIISGIKKLRKGETVGYNNTFTAPHDMTIATLPVGYNEGVDRRLSNKGVVKIVKTGVVGSAGGAEFFCPIVGRVSMNITVIDISKISGAKNSAIEAKIGDIKIGDEVIVFSSNKKDLNSIENVAKTCDTISYEIAVHIPQYLRRVLV